MADINDPQVIRWVNEELRPMAEAIIRLLEQNSLFLNDYNEQMAPLLASNVGTDNVLDGRTSEGVSRLTMQDITNFISVANGLDTAAGDAARTRVRKPTVRPIRLR